MRILHLSTTDIKGGAALGAYWLHEGLLQAGCDSTMLVQEKYSDDPFVLQSKTVFKINSKYINARIIAERLIQKILRMKQNENAELVSPQIFLPSGLAKEINALNPDIVHVHWTQGGYLMPEDIPKIKVPIIYTARDMWLLGNGRHYFDESEQFEGSLHQRNARAFSKKRNIIFVGISHWLGDLMRKNTALENHTVEVIQNGVPVQYFNPISPDRIKQQRQILGLNPDSYYILYGAQNATTDTRKGYEYIQSAQNSYKDNPQVRFLVFGNGAAEKGENIEYLGNLSRETLAQYYQIADVTLVPSKQDGQCGNPRGW